MAFTPLLRPLNQNGTTFYTFSSAAKDLSKCMANSQKEFVFSHFVCINIPDFINQANYDHNGQSLNDSSFVPTTIDKNYFQFAGIHDSLDMDYNDNAVKSTSEKLACHLQDYVFNFEELLISNSADNNTDRSVAERVFWHWLKEIGAINFTFDQNKIAQALVNRQEPRYVEGCSDLPNYENIVKYIGSIDITNNVDVAGEAYTEIYVHIPSEAGMTPTVLFKQEFDGNFSEGGEYEVFNNQDYILGQSGPDTSFPLDLRALYDSRANNEYKYIVANEIGYGMQPSTVYEYYNPQSDTSWVAKTYKTGIDGLCIDFDSNSYNEIVSNNIQNMDEFNKLGNSFEFNAVLVYYDIVDRSSQTRTSNLYGILFLDDVKSESWDYFQRYPKYKPIQGVQNGNSYGFKLNLRIDIEPDKNGVTTLVNEYNTFSMSLFADAMTKMQECADMFVKTKNILSDMQSRITDLETVMSAITNYEELANIVDELSVNLENANLAFADRNTLLDLIAHVSDNVDSIMQGKANVELQYNTDVLRNGYNTEVDSSTPNIIKINSKTSGYGLCEARLDDNSIIDANNKMNLNDQVRANNDIYTSLKPMSNMLRIYVEYIPAEYDIDIHIDSSLVNWKAGQNFKIVFPDMSLQTLNNYNINIKNGNDTLDTINYNELINDNPIIELICIDPTLNSNNPFVHDILR